MLAVSTGAACGVLFGCGGTTSYRAPNRDGGLESDEGDPANLPETGATYPRMDARTSAAQPDARSPIPVSDSGAIVTPACRITDENILGPYYKEGAPFRDDIRDGESGDVLIVSGFVLGQDGCTPLVDAIVDIWQANPSGAYDSAGFTLRGRLRTDDSGRYSLTTIFPGRYLNGSTYRPAHIHYRVSHPDNVDLTTQLYFSGDPFNPTDPFILDSLIMPVSETSADAALVRQVRFDVVLA